MKVIVIKKKIAYDITDLVQNITWGGNINQVSRKLTFQIIKSEDYYTPKFDVQNGDFVKLINEDENVIHSGIVFLKETDRAGGTVNITVYDPLIYLTKNITTKVADKIRVTEFIKSLCTEFGIELIKVPAISTSLEGVFRDMSLYDMILKALESHSQLTNTQYQLKMSSDALMIEEVGSQSIVINLETGVDEIYTISVSESIEELKNAVFVRGNGDNIIAEAIDTEMMTKYGRMQYQVTDDKMDKSKSEIYAQNLLKELCKEAVDINIQMKGNDQIRAGDKLTLKDEVLGINATYIVEEDSHNMTESAYTMNLKLLKR